MVLSGCRSMFCLIHHLSRQTNFLNPFKLIECSLYTHYFIWHHNLTGTTLRAKKTGSHTASELWCQALILMFHWCMGDASNTTNAKKCSKVFHAKKKLAYSSHFQGSKVHNAALLTPPHRYWDQGRFQEEVHHHYQKTSSSKQMGPARHIKILADPLLAPYFGEWPPLHQLFLIYQDWVALSANPAGQYAFRYEKIL